MKEHSDKCPECGKDKIGPCPFTEEDMIAFFNNLPEIILRLRKRISQESVTQRTPSEILSESS